MFVVCISLSDVAKKWLRAFGSQSIDKLQFRDSFVMFGQRGLAVPGTAVEQVDVLFTLDYNLQPVTTAER